MKQVVDKKIRINWDTTLSPFGFKLGGAHIVNFLNRYAIDGCLLGKRITFHYSEYSALAIVFPSLIKGGYIHQLGFPGLLERYGMDESEWGMIKSYQDLNKPDTIVALVSSILVECYTNERGNGPTRLDIIERGKKVVHALQVLSPDSVKPSSYQNVNDICEITMSTLFNERGEGHIEGNFSGVIDRRKERITLSNIIEAIRNVDKNISLPYEMLDNARVSFDHRDTRAAVLNCATAIEVLLKRKVLAFLDDSTQSKELKEYVLNQANGFAKLVELCNKFGLPLLEMPNVRDTVFSIRNRVIHGGYVPSVEEAKKAIDCSRETMSVYNVPIFECL